MRHPEDIRNYFWLLDLLIADGRTSEAREYAEAMKQVEYTYHYEMYMGQICKTECDLPSALDWWKEMTEHSLDNWIVWAEYADCMVKLCRCEEAILSYKKAIGIFKNQVKIKPGEISGAAHLFPLWLYYSRKKGIFQDLSLLFFVVQYTQQGEDFVLSLQNQNATGGWIYEYDRPYCRSIDALEAGIHGVSLL